MAQTVKNLPAMQERDLGLIPGSDPCKKRTATHSSILIWRIPRTEEPGELQSMGSQESNTNERIALSLFLTRVRNLGFIGAWDLYEITTVSSLCAADLLLSSLYEWKWQAQPGAYGHSSLLRHHGFKCHWFSIPRLAPQCWSLSPIASQGKSRVRSELAGLAIVSSGVTLGKQSSLMI